MKIRNTKNQVVRIRLPKFHVSFEIMPFETLPIDMKTRQAITPYIKQFGLKLETDIEDFKKMPQKEVGEQTPNVHDSGTAVIDENDGPSDEDMEKLLFSTKVEETESTTKEEFGTTKESSRNNEDGITDASASIPEKEIEKLADTCPYTQQQLTFKAKAELFEICEELGLDQDGTKREIVERILGMYAS